MTVVDAFKGFFSLSLGPEPMQQRAAAEVPSFDEQISAIITRRTANPWLAHTVREAMGVPGIFRAVSLIANTTGRLVPRAYRNGERMLQTDAPRLIIRPDPGTTPRDFYRDTAYYISTRGEAWWWVAARDGYGQALSLVVVPPWEVSVEQNPDDRRRPTIKWGAKTMPNDDMRHITFLPDDQNIYRGVGPLQLCGAAVSVAVEAHEWAANYFAGAPSTVTIWTSHDMGESGARNLKAQYLEGTPNMPRVISHEDVDEIEDNSPDPAKAQMTDTRKEAKGDAATMFGIPGALLEYAQSGTSLTYQNVEDIWRNFQEGCLTPNYLEPIEQALSDLLPRAVISQFDLAELLRSQPLTRAQIYNLLVPLGIMAAEQAAQAEGWQPGSAEYMPVPPAPPQAIPGRLPIDMRTRSAPVDVHCSGQKWVKGRLVPCRRPLGRAVAPYSFRCPRCGGTTESDAA